MAFNFQHILEWRRNEEDMMITLHSTSTTVGPSAAHALWNTAVGEIWGPGTGGNPGYRSVTGAALISNRTLTYYLDPLTFKKIERFETPQATAGTDVAQLQVPGVCLVMSLESAGQPARRNGRLYLPAPSLDQYGFGYILQSCLTVALTAVKKGLAAMYAGGLEPTVLNQQTGEQLGITDVSAWDRAGFRRGRENAYHYTRQRLHVFP